MLFATVRRRCVGAIAGAFALAIIMQSGLARADCASGMAACPSDLGGQCVPEGSVCCPGGSYVPVGAVCEKDPTGNWGAIAIATWNDGKGDAKVSATVQENQPSLSQASTAALLGCQKAAVRLCHIVGTFSSGKCGYVSLGHNAKAVRWAVSAKPEEALSTCSAEGITCQQPIGGCNRP